MTRLATMSATLLLITAVAGCDPGGSPSSTPPSSAATGQQALDIAREWVQCLRDRGLTRMPDPRIDEQGHITYAAPADGYEFKRDLLRRPEAAQACQPIIDRLPASARRRSDVSPADIRTLTEFAKCVRSKGVAEFPDPNAHGEFDLTGTPLENARLESRVDPALKACRGVWSGEVSVVGGAGDKSGGGKK